ncbi:MAG TPA: ATP-binding protein [Pirellulales bacterium]|nr:ATP-binding protein [Pirellulales bacterium]
MSEPDRASVLIVDDDEKNLVAYTGMLQGLEVRPVLACSGREALKCLLEEEFAVIVLDVNMPEMDGFETASLIRAREKSQHIPLIFATASYKEDLQIFRGYSLGAVDYLIKPLTPDIFRSKIAVLADLYAKTRQIERQAAALRDADRKIYEERLAQERHHCETECLRQQVEAEKALAEAVRDLNTTLENRVRELDRANRELERKNDENEMFVYSVSHDLRSPLVNLQGFSHELGSVCDQIRQILSAANLPETDRQRGVELLDRQMSEAIRFIQTAVSRLSNIICALLRLSRVGRVEYTWQEVDVEQIVARVVDSMHAVIMDRRAQVTASPLPTAWGDSTALEQLFANLISNALNYLAPARPGIIEIGSDWQGESNGETCTYFVKDNGLGIPREYQHKLFRAFQRLHPETTAGEGIGLAAVKRIVDRHSGKIWLDSQVDMGTTFYVTLPTQADRSDPFGEREAIRSSDLEVGCRMQETSVSGAFAPDSVSKEGNQLSQESPRQ